MSEAHPEITTNHSTAILILLGGLCAGSGIMTLLFGFEAGDGRDFAEQISTLGFTGLDNITIKTAGKIGFGLIALGIALAVTGNSRAWKSTGGY